MLLGFLKSLSQKNVAQALALGREYGMSKKYFPLMCRIFFFFKYLNIVINEEKDERRGYHYLRFNKITQQKHSFNKNMYSIFRYDYYLIPDYGEGDDNDRLAV